MATKNYINTENSTTYNNTELLESISREFIAEFGRGVTSHAELLMAVDVAKMNEFCYSNNNFNPERFKKSLTKILSAVSASDGQEVDDLYMMHILHSPNNSFSR